MSQKFPLPGGIIDVHNHLRSDDDGSQLIELMEQSNIEMTLIMGSSQDVDVRNQAIVDACRRHPGRFVGGAYYDPREGEKAIDALKHYSSEGLPVVKLFPNLGYYPDDEGLRPFWDAVAEEKMTVLSHCGWLGGSGPEVTQEPWAAYYSHPGRFEKVIRLYPDTVFILAHMGGIAGLLETVMLTTRTANTFVDCSPGQGLWALQAGGAIAGSVPPEKLMWGADGYGQAGLLETYRHALVGVGFGPHLERIFYANAHGLFEKMVVLGNE